MSDSRRGGQRYLHPVNREILRLALPNILSNISVPLISSFDTALMGSLGSTHIAAVGLGSMAFNFVYWNFGFLRMGTTGLTAQAFGRGSAQEQAITLFRGGLLALGIGLLLVLLQTPALRMSGWLLNIRADQLPLVEEYFHIRIFAAPAALLQMVLLGWFFGRQNAVWPLLLTLAVNSANLALSYYLVAYAGWGIAGVAWGTVAAPILRAAGGDRIPSLRAVPKPRLAPVRTHPAPAAPPRYLGEPHGLLSDQPGYFLSARCA